MGCLRDLRKWWNRRWWERLLVFEVGQILLNPAGILLCMPQYPSVLSKYMIWSQGKYSILLPPLDGTYHGQLSPQLEFPPCAVDNKSEGASGTSNLLPSNQNKPNMKPAQVLQAHGAPSSYHTTQMHPLFGKARYMAGTCFS